MSIAALILDADGTLADTEEVHRQAFNAAFREHGLPWSWSVRDYAALVAISGGKERILRYIDSLGEAEPERARLAQLVAAAHRSKTRIYAELVAAGGAPLRPGVERLIHEARDAGVHVAIASGTTRKNVEALIACALGEAALGWFDVIACADEVAQRKPAPDFYRFVLAALKLPASACVAIEDSAKGLRAAQAAGLYTVVTPTIWTYGEDFSSAGLVLRSLGDPLAPLDAVSAAAAGGPFLVLSRLDALHAAWYSKRAA